MYGVFCEASIRSSIAIDTICFPGIMANPKTRGSSEGFSSKEKGSCKHNKCKNGNYVNL